MPIDHHVFLALLQEKMPEATIHLEDLVGDGDHYRLEVISSRFRGMSRIAQHRHVHELLKGTAAENLHALALSTLSESTPLVSQPF